MNRYFIVANSGNGERFWYVGRNRWSNKRSDAMGWNSTTQARLKIVLACARLPKHITWAKAYIEPEGTDK